MKTIFGSGLIIILFFSTCLSEKQKEKNNELHGVSNIKTNEIDYDRALPEKRVIYLDESTGLFDVSEIYTDTLIKKYATNNDEAAGYYQHYAARLISNEKYDLAIAECKYALAYKRDYVVVYVMIADCFRRLSQKDSSVYYINTALALDSSDQAAKLMKQEIDERFSLQQDK
ncbi:MAG: tetratricopeptide repeat protein [Bacteroidales bacterium]